MNNESLRKSSIFHPNPSTFNTHRRQYFSLPFGIISYITQKPTSANGLSKLQKTCKYFFAKNKIIVLDLEIKSANEILPEFKLYYNLIRYSIGFKFWFINGFGMDSWYPRYQLKISEKVYRCNLRSLSLGLVTLPLNEFNFLINDGKLILLSLNEVEIYDENGVLETLDKILAKTPNVEYIYYSCANELFTTETFIKMNSLVFNSKIDGFKLSVFNLAPNTDVTLLCDFAKKNCGSNKYFYILFLYDGEEMSALKASIDKMIQTWDSEETPPIFCINAIIT